MKTIIDKRRFFYTILPCLSGEPYPMPSGRTHDRITLWSLPFVAGLTFGQTRSSHLTLLVTASFLFSGLMFGPDLDIPSRQYQRWGWLRWLWLPYQTSLYHRSFLSHGPLIGTALRILYLLCWVMLFGLVGLFIAQATGKLAWNFSDLMQILWRTLPRYSQEWIAIYIGLELGAMSHYFSDGCSSFYKWLKRQTRKHFKSASTSQRPSSRPVEPTLPPMSPSSSKRKRKTTSNPTPTTPTSAIKPRSRRRKTDL